MAEQLSERRRECFKMNNVSIYDQHSPKKLEEPSLQEKLSRFEEGTVDLEDARDVFIGGTHDLTGNDSRPNLQARPLL